MTYGPTSEQKLNTTYFISRDSVCVLILEALPGIETVSDIFFVDKFTKGPFKKDVTEGERVGR